VRRGVVRMRVPARAPRPRNLAICTTCRGRRGEALSTAAAGPRDEDAFCACASAGCGGSPWGVCRKGGRESGASGVFSGGGDRIARHSAPAAIWNTLHGCRVLSCLCACACACVAVGRV
jgi:hypothetical protein